MAAESGIGVDGDATRDVDIQERRKIGRILADHLPDAFRYLTGCLAAQEALWSLDLNHGEFQIDQHMALLLRLPFDQYSWSRSEAEGDERIVALYQHLTALAVQVKQQGDGIFHTGWRLAAQEGGSAKIHFRGVLVDDHLLAGIATPTTGVQTGSSDTPDQEEGLTVEVLQAALDVGRDLVAISSASGKALYISASAEKLYGYTQEELAGSGIFDFCHPDDFDQVQAWAHKMSEGVPGSITVRVRHRNGKWMWVEVYGSPHELSDGSRVLIIHQWVVDHYRSEIDDGHAKREALQEALDQRGKSLEEAKTAMNAVILAAEGIMDGLGGEDISSLIKPLQHRLADALDNPSASADELRSVIQNVHDAMGAMATNVSDTADGNPKSFKKIPGLTKRETEVARLVAEDLASKEIAARLGVSKGSVDVHRKSIRQKLQLDRRQNLVEALQRVVG